MKRVDQLHRMMAAVATVTYRVVNILKVNLSLKSWLQDIRFAAQEDFLPLKRMETKAVHSFARGVNKSLTTD